jgi:serine/threonine-protein kinase
LLDRKLTEGGMAEIFLGRPNPMLAAPDLLARRSPIVVKRLFAHHSSEAEFVRMFFNEARLASRIKHPNIVDIFDQGEADGTYYLAMEYIHGEDLRGFVQQSDAVGKRPPIAVVCRIIMDTLAGLHYAHTLTDEDGQPLGLVHRDVSPQNVLVTYDGAVKLIDFGIAKATRALNSEQTQAGLIKGKYAYMSPEQTRGDLLDARSDVFSAGTLLWELLVWRRLFKRATDLATLVAVTEEPAPSTQLYNAEVPKELDDITMRALAPSRNDRWGSAKEFLDALQRCVDAQGWDSSSDAVGLYMHEIFAEKLAKEAAPAPVEERASAGLPMGHRIPKLPGQGAPSGSSLDPRTNRPRAMTMPLQVINPAMAQQARKAMVVPKSSTSLPGGAASAAPPSARSEGPRRPSPPAIEPPQGSMPMRIAPDAPGTPRQSMPLIPSAPLVTTPDPGVQLQLASRTGIEMMPVPQDPTVPIVTTPPPGTLAAATRRRILVAVIIGVVIGVLAVLLLQVLGSRSPR